MSVRDIIASYYHSTTMCVKQIEQEKRKISINKCWVQREKVSFLLLLLSRLISEVQILNFRAIKDL